MVGDPRRDNLVLDKLEAIVIGKKMLATPAFEDLHDEADAAVEKRKKLLEGLKNKSPAALAAIAGKEENRGDTVIQEIARFANQTRAVTLSEVNNKLTALSAELNSELDLDEEIDLSQIIGNGSPLTSTADVKNKINEFLAKDAGEIFKALPKDDGFFSWFSSDDEPTQEDDEKINAIKTSLRNALTFAESPAPLARDAEEIRKAVEKFDKETTADFSELKNLSPGDFNSPEIIGKFGSNPKFQELLAYVNSPKIDQTAVNEFIDKEIRLTGGNLIGIIPIGIIGIAVKNLEERKVPLTLGNFENELFKVIEEKIKEDPSGEVGKLFDKIRKLNKEEIKELLSGSKNLSQIDVAQRNQQLKDLEESQDPERGLFENFGGSSLSGFMKDAPEWVQEKIASINEWMEENPDKAFWGKVGIAGMGFLAAGMALKKIPVIGGVLAFVANIIGGIGALWGGLNLTLDFLGFKKGMGGGGQGQEMPDPFNVITLEGSEAKVRFNKGLMLQETDQALAKIKVKDPDMYKKLEAAKQELAKDKLSPEAKVQLGTVIRKINESSDVAKTLNEMKTNGVASISTTAMMRELLGEHPDLVRKSIITTADGKDVIGKESIDAIMQTLKDNKVITFPNADPLGIGIKINGEAAVRGALIEAVKEKVKGMQLDFEPEKITGIIPKLKFITSQATETPEQERLAVAAAEFREGKGSLEGQIGANGHATNKKQQLQQTV